MSTDTTTATARRALGPKGRGVPVDGAQRRRAAASPPALETTVSARPLIKWAGGKTKLLPELVKRLPERFPAYHEPFVGGGALFWHLANAGRLKKNYVTLSDTCEPLMRTWRAIKDDASKVIELLKRMPITEAHFYKVRGISPEDLRGLRDFEIAAWFIFLNKTDFNGLYRVNASGAFNVPWGKWDENKLPTVCDAPNLLACGALLQKLRVAVLARPFESVLDYAKPGDFVYADPPYLPTSKTADFTSYTSGGFDYEDHVRLRDVARELKEKGVHVMITNSDVPLVRELYESWSGFQVEEVFAPRSINSKGTGRGAVREIIVR